MNRYGNYGLLPPGDPRDRLLKIGGLLVVLYLSSQFIRGRVVVLQIMVNQNSSGSTLQEPSYPLG